MVLIVRVIKPRLIHSHTIKANLISSLTASFYGIPCIISFTGMGTLSKTKGFKKLLFLTVLKIIKYSSLFQGNSSWNINKKKDGWYLFFKIQETLINLEILLILFFKDNNKLIIGSGLPSKYLKKELNFKWSNHQINSDFHEKINFIYCGRLLRTKGILDFIELAIKFDNLKFSVYGGIDLFNNDSLKEFEITKFSNEIRNLTFYGVKENPLLYQKSELPILMVPSNYGEGLPRSILEALALKIPVICSKNATCDVFSEELLYVSDRYINSYVKSLERLLDDYKENKFL